MSKGQAPKKLFHEMEVGFAQPSPPSSSPWVHDKHQHLAVHDILMNAGALFMGKQTLKLTSKQPPWHLQLRLDIPCGASLAFPLSTTLGAIEVPYHSCYHLNIWTPQKKVLNIAWHSNGLKIVSFHRGHWEKQLHDHTCWILAAELAPPEGQFCIDDGPGMTPTKFF